MGSPCPASSRGGRSLNLASPSRAEAGALSSTTSGVRGQQSVREVLEVYPRRQPNSPGRRFAGLQLLELSPGQHLVQGAIADIQPGDGLVALSLEHDL